MFGLTKPGTKAPGKPMRLRALACMSGPMVDAMKAAGVRISFTIGGCILGRTDACTMVNIMTTRSTAWERMCGRMGSSMRGTGKMGKCTDKADLQTRQEKAELECGLTENAWSGCRVQLRIYRLRSLILQTIHTKLILILQQNKTTYHRSE